MDKSNHQRKLNSEGIKVPAEGRVLLIVPILHTKEDMGSLGNRLPRQDGYTLMVSKFWEEVGERVKKYLDGFQKVKVYQDGLPDTDKKLVEKIIKEVKSPNYGLLRFLKAQGAKILGSEDPRLLKEEYQFISQILAAQDQKSKSELRQAYEGQADNLLAKRDHYIAKRIDETLGKGERGILFIGAAHQIKDKLAKDIQVEIL